MAKNPRCTVTYWTDKRFAAEVIDAMDAAVSQYAARAPGQKINLVGYSGGAAVAALIAARRQDVASLRTVAGNLDHVAVNRLHQVSPMPDSLNAIDVAAQLVMIAQIHFSGADDEVVPTAIARHFAAAVGGHCTQMIIIKGMSHESDWSARWPSLLKRVPACQSGEKDD